MEEYKAILKLINDKLEEQESVIEYYRNKQKEWEEHTNKLTETNLSLKAKIDGFEAEKVELLHCIGLQEDEIKQLREKIASLEEKVTSYEIPKKVANV